MKAKKIINNNIIYAYGDSDEELIVIGKGIGYGIKTGDEITKHHIEKVFIMRSSEHVERFKKQIREMSPKYIEIAFEVIAYGREVLKQELNENIYLTLADHIDFAIRRSKEGIMPPNPIINDIRRYMKKEFEVGKYAVKLIKRITGIQMPLDEAAYIALHFFYAEYEHSFEDVQIMTQIMNDILQYVQEYFHIVFDQNSINYERFVTHIKFLAHRLFSKENMNTLDSDFINLIQQKYPEEYRCSQCINELLKNTYQYDISLTETAYLAMHIRSLRNKNQTGI